MEAAKENFVNDRISSSKKLQAHFLDGPQLQENVTRFWLIRHAVVDSSVRKLMYGADNVPLCLTSLRQQEPIYERLACRLPKNADWISSPLKRAIHTAEAIKKAGNFEGTLQIESGFIEQSLGEWSSLPHQDFSLYPEQNPHYFWPLSATERPPQGESMEDVQKRVGTALDYWADKNLGKETIIISHGGAIRMALAHALGISATSALHFVIQNLSVTALEHIDGQWRVIMVNTLSHFEESAE
ncbi:phosphoglycerate mutase GpmB [Aristophania vespae]|nr:phosphoglycerate mutase GpmB [Aristophania vespae]